MNRLDLLEDLVRILDCRQLESDYDEDGTFVAVESMKSRDLAEWIVDELDRIGLTIVKA